MKWGTEREGSTGGERRKEGDGKQEREEELGEKRP
jgi:hypothetical protein